MVIRPAITKQLSGLIEKRLNSRRMFWSSEVDFDKNLVGNRRIDYVGFKPFTPNLTVEPVSVELGTFACYEVKSCLADFESGHGLTFYGDENYLVCPVELAEELQAKRLIPRNINAVLCPDRSGSRLLTKFEFNTDQSYRRRSAAEMLWAIVQAHKTFIESPGG